MSFSFLEIITAMLHLLTETNCIFPMLILMGAKWSVLLPFMSQIRGTDEVYITLTVTKQHRIKDMVLHLQCSGKQVEPEFVALPCSSFPFLKPIGS